MLLYLPAQGCRGFLILGKYHHALYRLVESVHYTDIGRLIFSRPVISYEALHVLLPYTPGLCSNSCRLVADDNVVVFVNDIWFSHVVTPANCYCKF